MTNKVYSKFNKYDEFIKNAAIRGMAPGSISKALNALENDDKFSSMSGVRKYMFKAKIEMPGYRPRTKKKNDSEALIEKTTEVL